MKRMITLLLIACSVITTASADSTAEPQKKPVQVIAQLNYVANAHGERVGQTYSVDKNPNTGIIESSERIVPIAGTMAGKGPYFSNIARAFMHDESLSYQFLHIEPGSTESFQLKVITNNGEKNKTIQLRSNKNQELWFMCCKNPDNPQLRDAYAIVWEVDYNGRKPMDTGSYPMKGTIYMITSLRPDLYQKNMSSAGLLSDNKNTFTIDGRVGYDINDSLYVVYMADNAEELNNVKDSDFVATMPVVNKRFTFSVELDKPKVGRIRTVMPDGSLCELWTNLDFVPGETYRITTHNGYYEQDNDYEQRVGRYSGKSLLNDLQKRGVDDATGKLELDPNKEEFYGVDVVPELQLPQSVNEMQIWQNSLSPEKKAEILQKATNMLAKIKMIEASYEPIAGVMKQGPAFLARLGTYVDMQCPEIIKQNKEMDKAVQDLVKSIKATNPPQKVIDEMYSQGLKEVLDVLTKQNNSFNEIFKARGSLSKKAKEAQKYINSLTEKYINEMSKHVTGTK
jgi:hypothetical protein